MGAALRRLLVLLSGSRHRRRRLRTQQGLDSRRGPAIDRAVAAGAGCGGGVAMRRRICGLIGRLPITGFDTRLASGSSLRGTLWPACTWPPPRARLFGIRIGCGRARRASWAGAVRGLHANRVKRPCGPRSGAYRCAAAELSCCVRTERTGAGSVGAVRANGTDGGPCP